MMEWISVKKELPKVDGELFLCMQDIENDDFKVIVLWFDAMCSKFRSWGQRNDLYWPRDEDGSHDNVTHWMPLPNPPKQ